MCVYIYVVRLLLVLFLLFASGVLILQSPFHKNMFARHGAGQKARMASTTFSPRSRTWRAPCPHSTSNGWWRTRSNSKRSSARAYWTSSVRSSRSSRVKSTSWWRRIRRCVKCTRFAGRTRSHISGDAHGDLRLGLRVDGITLRQEWRVMSPHFDTKTTQQLQNQKENGKKSHHVSFFAPKREHGTKTRWCNSDETSGDETLMKLAISRCA